MEKWDVQMRYTACNRIGYQPSLAWHAAGATGYWLAAIDMEQEEKNHMVASPETLQKIKQAAEKDKTYAAQKQQIATGWLTDRHVIPEDLQPYFTFSDELATSNDFVYKGSRTVVPVGVRYFILQRLHSSHMGVNGCLWCARELAFWPGMTTQLKERIARCHACQTYQAAVMKEPLLSHDVPDRP